MMMAVRHRMGVRDHFLRSGGILRVCPSTFHRHIVYFIYLRFSISSQAYLDVSQAVNPALSYGADGIAGLGFTSLSTIDAWVNHTGGSTGRSMLYNAFAANPSEPNYIAFSLQRSTDPSSDVEGSFSIGEVESQYSAVLNSTALSTWPIAAPSRWNVLLDAVIVGSKTVAVSSDVTGVPSGQAVVLLDSGTSYT